MVFLFIVSLSDSVDSFKRNTWVGLIILFVSFMFIVYKANKFNVENTKAVHIYIIEHRTKIEVKEECYKKDVQKIILVIISFFGCCGLFIIFYSYFVEIFIIPYIGLNDIDFLTIKRMREMLILLLIK